MSAAKDMVKISKFLSLVLRHSPETVGVHLDEAGWANVDELLRACERQGIGLTLEELRMLVDTNDKKRFAFSADGQRIRASQGHSIEVELGYVAQTPPAVLYHGTASRFIAPIKESGRLHKGSRQHVHLSTSQETASTVGARHGKVVVLKVDAQRMQQDGYLFYLSDNGVWLTDHVPLCYISFP